MADAAALMMRGIAKLFGETAVLHDVDLEIRAGEFLAMVGPSGCGKSTLLRILAGFEAADAGTVSIGGRDVTAVRAADRDLAMVSQPYALYPHLSVAANMATPLVQRELNAFGRLPVVGPLMSRGARHKISAGVQEAAEVLHIEALLARKPGQLCGGQRQRVAIGRAMVREPVAFLMDEPLADLDAALRVHMRAELAALHGRLQRSFIYVIHDQAEALTLSDRMAVMRGGRILQLGAPSEVYNDPATLEVALFIDSPRINTLPGEVDSAGRVSRMGVALRRRAIDAAAARVTVAVRPQHLAVRDTASADTITGTLTYARKPWRKCSPAPWRWRWRACVDCPGRTAGGGRALSRGRGACGARPRRSACV